MPETSRKPRIALGSDRAGFHIKETIRQFLDNSGGPVNDPGTWSEESVDSPDDGKAVGESAHVFLNTPFQGRQVENIALVEREESKKHWQKQEKR
jgi:ribose 5-phosphate isomerase RpiB